jgi:hypothetical protein
MKLKKDSYVNDKHTYAIINSKTKKVLKCMGALEYHRTSAFAHIRQKQLRNKFGIKDTEIIKLK